MDSPGKLDVLGQDGTSLDDTYFFSPKLKKNKITNATLKFMFYSDCF